MITRRALKQTLFIFISINVLLFWFHYTRNNAIQSKYKFFNLLLPLNDTHESIEITSKLVKFINRLNLFVIEPHILSGLITKQEREELQWRFNLEPFPSNSKSLTVATFDTNIDNVLSRLKNTSIVVYVVMGPVLFSDHTKMLHIFFQFDSIRLHLVVLHKIKHFHWIGQIPRTEQKYLLKHFNLQFGLYQEIYDPIEINSSLPFRVPKEMSHFLSQLPTSRYMHCPKTRLKWNQKHNIPPSFKRINATVEAITLTKELMKELRMEFWAMCGTLLGWYRQCEPIPYTTDTDFSTWPKYLKRENLTSKLRTSARKHQMRLLYRFGEPNKTMEYSLMTKSLREKVDMFFSYSNGTHFFVPSHVVSKHTYMYSIYPSYELCSIELLGYKLLAPCDPLKIILTEYGSAWNQPSPKWDYVKSPSNSGPSYPFPTNISQYKEYPY